MTDRLKAILEPVEPEVVATGFTFTEGPLWHPNGFLYVSDVGARVHYKVILASGEKQVIRKNSGGANGSTFDLKGRLVTVEQDARRMVRTEQDGTLTILADSYEGNRLNRCNDIVRHSSGSLYFTDPGTYLEASEREIGSSAVFRLLPAGNLELLATDMSHPNGLAFSPDEKLLYVSNTRPDPHLRVYRVRRDGKLGHSNVFAEMPYVPAPQGTTFVTDEGRVRPATEKGGVPDGLKVDIEGRIYCTGPGGIWVWEPDGTYLGLITLPELPANLAWGEHDHRSLYITARTSVYRLRTGVPGIAPL